MKNFRQVTENTIQFDIDTTLYSDNIVSKVLYWLVADYFITQATLDDNTQQISLELKVGVFTQQTLLDIKSKVNQNLIDFKMRTIITEETANIRDILYIKAFANSDDFEDYNLIAD